MTFYPEPQFRLMHCSFLNEIPRNSRSFPSQYFTKQSDVPEQKLFCQPVGKVGRPHAEVGGRHTRSWAMGIVPSR
jgi:hypothetical protein